VPAADRDRLREGPGDRSHGRPGGGPDDGPHDRSHPRPGGAADDRPGPAGWYARAGLISSGSAVALLLTVSALGPSVMQPGLPGRAGQPPYSFAAGPAPVLAVSLTAAGFVLAVVGLALCLYAGRRGGWFRPRALAGAGMLAALAFAIMPPVGSADHLNYAAYGRMAITGHDPYVTAARDLDGDPIARAVEPPWQEEPSVYGPIATATQAFAATVGGDSVRLTIAVLSLLNVVIFMVAGVLLHVAARGDPRRQWRAAVLWTANPLLLYHLAGGAHNDTFAIALVVAAAVVLGRFGARSSASAASAASTPAASTFAASTPPASGAAASDAETRPAAGTGGPPARGLAAAGALVGVGVAVKLQAVLAAAGPAWVALPAVLRRLPFLRTLPAPGPGPRSFGPLAVLFAAIAAVAVPAYVVAGSHAFDQVRRASDAVSLATPWQLVRRLLDEAMGLSWWRPVVQLGALALMVTLCWLLLRALPTVWPPAPGTLHGGGRGAAPGAVPGAVPAEAGPFRAGGAVDDAARATAAAALAWLMSAPYALPWYDGLGWALLALLPWSRFDWVLLARTAVLSLAYLPARDPAALAAVGMPADLEWLVTVLRAQVIPWVSTGILLALVVACLRRPRPAEAYVHSPPAPAERPR
jgi:hypothetical protein